MTAIPLKMNKSESAISPLFGHAKWFAFVEGEKISIEANPFDGGMPVVQWLLSRGVSEIVTQHIGAGPFRFLLMQGVEAFYPGEGRVTLPEALERLRAGEMERITPENIERFARHQHRHGR